MTRDDEDEGRPLARRRGEDSRDDEEFPRRQGNPRVWVGGLAGLLVLAAFGLGVIVGRSTVAGEPSVENRQGLPLGPGPQVAKQVQEQAVPGPPEPAPISREAFRAAVTGKTPAQVTAAVGKPARDGDGVWHYVRRTLDPGTGAADRDAAVTFENGVATGVAFE